jgi:hypothetical protein
LELLRELVPGTARVAVLVNPAEAAVAETTLRDVETAARGFGLQVQVFRADTPDEINAAFESMGFRLGRPAPAIGPGTVSTSVVLLVLPMLGAVMLGGDREQAGASVGATELDHRRRIAAGDRQILILSASSEVPPVILRV